MIGYWLGTIMTPGKSFTQLAQENSIWPGLFAALLYALLYLLTELVLIVRALPLSAPATLPIPAQVYYRWQFFFTVPVVLVAWLLLSELVYALATYLFGGRGERRHYRNLVSFAFHVPFTLTLWVAETGTALFWPQLWGNSTAPGAAVGYLIWQTLLWIGVIWSALLSAQAIKSVSGLTWPKSLLTASVAIAATIGFYMIFIR